MISIYIYFKVYNEGGNTCTGHVSFASGRLSTSTTIARIARAAGVLPTTTSAATRTWLRLGTLVDFIYFLKFIMHSCGEIDCQRAEARPGLSFPLYIFFKVYSDRGGEHGRARTGPSEAQGA